MLAFSCFARICERCEKNKKKRPTSIRGQRSVLEQVCKHIPQNITTTLAKQFGVDKRVRSFSAWSHVVSLLFAQFVHALSLSEVCDALIHHRGRLGRIRGAEPLSKSGLAHANANRAPRMAEALFLENT
jgi:hypothetical protein